MNTFFRSKVSALLYTFIFLVFPLTHVLAQATTDTVTNQDGTTNNTAQNYSLEDGDYSVFFPAQPTLSTSTEDFGNGNSTVSDFQYSDLAADDSTGFQATYAESALANLTTSPDDSLQDEVYYTSNHYGYSVLSSQITTYQGMPAITFQAFNKSLDRYYVGKDVAKGNDLYMLGYFYPSGGENQSLESTFFNSLTFPTPTPTTTDDSGSGTAGNIIGWGIILLIGWWIVRKINQNDPLNKGKNQQHSESSSEPKTQPKYHKGGDMKKLHRSLLKKYHPDFAKGEDDKKFRTELTAKINKAYDTGDEATLNMFM